MRAKDEWAKFQKKAEVMDDVAFEVKQAALPYDPDSMDTGDMADSVALALRTLKDASTSRQKIDDMAGVLTKASEEINRLQKIKTTAVNVLAMLGALNADETECLASGQACEVVLHRTVKYKLDVDGDESEPPADLSFLAPDDRTCLMRHLKEMRRIEMTHDDLKTLTPDARLAVKGKFAQTVGQWRAKVVKVEKEELHAEVPW